MKKLVLLLLLVILPVQAIISENIKHVNGDIARADYSKVTCERQKQIGSVGRDQRVCCLNKDENEFCSLDEPLIGDCESSVCVWPTKTYKPWYSWRYRRPPCEGLAVLSGKEYAPLLEWAGCKKKDVFWCCNQYAFPPLEPKLKPNGGLPPSTNTPTGALLILSDTKWTLMKKGGLKDMKPERRAFEYEQQRCAAGGKNLRIIDRKYGSFFSDVNNLKPGMRVFYLTKSAIVPLVTSCD